MRCRDSLGRGCIGSRGLCGDEYHGSIESVTKLGHGREIVIGITYTLSDPAI